MEHSKTIDLRHISSTFEQQNTELFNRKLNRQRSIYLVILGKILFHQIFSKKIQFDIFGMINKFDAEK